MSDPAATKRALLDAGRAEFAQHGLAGGRTDRIAAASGVNKQRIFAHFGSKEGLFEAVLADALDDILDVVPLPETNLGGAEAVAEHVRQVASYHRDHPELLRLIQWESLESSSEVVLTSARAAKYREKVVAFAARLGVAPERAAPLFIQVIILAAGPQAMSRFTALVLGMAPNRALDIVNAWSGQSAIALVQTYLGDPSEGAP